MSAQKTIPSGAASGLFNTNKHNVTVSNLPPPSTDITHVFLPHPDCPPLVLKSSKPSQQLPLGMLVGVAGTLPVCVPPQVYDIVEGGPDPKVVPPSAAVVTNFIVGSVVANSRKYGDAAIIGPNTAGSSGVYDSERKLIGVRSFTEYTQQPPQVDVKVNYLTADQVPAGTIVGTQFPQKLFADDKTTVLATFVPNLPKPVFSNPSKRPASYKRKFGDDEFEVCPTGVVDMIDSIPPKGTMNPLIVPENSGKFIVDHDLYDGPVLSFVGTGGVEVRDEKNQMIGSTRLYFHNWEKFIKNPQYFVQSNESASI